MRITVCEVTMDLGILPEPPGPEFYDECPNCRLRCSLKLESSIPDEKAGMLRTYACKHCDAKITFADRHPPEAV